MVYCIDIDRKPRFCFIEYDSDAAAEKAVVAENGRDFKGGKLSMYLLFPSVCLAPKHMMHN